MTVRRTTAVRLTADDEVLRARVRAASRYDGANSGERALIDAFLGRTARCQALLLDAVDRLGLERMDAGDGRTVGAMADAVLAAVVAQQAVGRGPSAER